jgi:hypothetical protein
MELHLARETALVCASAGIVVDGKRMGSKFEMCPPIIKRCLKISPSWTCGILSLSGKCYRFVCKII